MDSGNEKIIIGIFVIGVILAGILLLPEPTNRREVAPMYLNQGVRSKVKKSPMEDLETFVPKQSRGGKSYKNTETWDIEWNDDGLPKRVTIHRDAVQT